VIFKELPRLGLRPRGAPRPAPNELTIRLDPSTGMRMKFEAMRAESTDPEPVYFNMLFAEQGGEGPTPYEVLLRAALVGNSTRFTRQDGVEDEWEVMQPLLDSPPPVHAYVPGSWGPDAANSLVADYGGWREPWVETS
jgi:glucose-6-phosphate 1-dehydrogenase